jgi:hypothetical protein
MLCALINYLKCLNIVQLSILQHGYACVSVTSITAYAAKIAYIAGLLLPP